MADRSFFLTSSVLGEVRLGSNLVEEQRAVGAIIEEGLKADGDRQSWIDRQQALTRLRYGIRKPKFFPWKGASNLSVPLIDSQIRRYKPMLMRLVVESDPIVEFVGEDSEAVASERKCEAEYNWLFRTNMNATEPLAYIIDAMCHRGYGIAQVGWDYQTEYTTRVVLVDQLFPGGAPPSEEEITTRLVDEFKLNIDDPRVVRALTAAVQKILDGAKAVKIGFKSAVVDRPAVWDRDPVQVIVPPRTTDYANSEWIVVQHIFSARKIKQLEADGFFKRGSIAKILGDRLRPTRPGGEVDSSDSLTSEQNLQDEKEQIWGTENDDNILIWEYFGWQDIDGDGLLDRVTAYIHPRSRTLLSAKPYAYPFARWPFVKYDFEKTSRRFHSPRGIPAMLEGIQRETNAQHNARLDAMTLRNAPVYQMPLMAGFRARNFRAVPGTVLQLPMGAQLTPVIQDRGGWPEQVQEENLLRMLSESYIGTFDQALQSMTGRDNRTATEVNAAMQLAASTASMDAICFQLAMRELHTMIWELWMEFRPEEVSYKVLGEDPSQNGPTLVTVKKSEVDKKYKLIPTGTIANTNRALELSNAREALQYFANDRTGTINSFELRSWYFTLLDYRRARRILNSPDAAREQVIMRQAADALSTNPQLAAQLGLPVNPNYGQAPQTQEVAPPTP